MGCDNGLDECGPQSTESTEHRVILVTGPSGAGRSTTIRVLEDLGYEGIDNIPLRLVPHLLEGPALGRPIAIGLDVRNRDFNASAMIEVIDVMTRDPNVDLEVLYLDCGASELMRRFSETRRRHPFAQAHTTEQAIEHEIDILTPIKVRADHVIDTSDLSPHDLKAELRAWFGDLTSGSNPHMVLSVQSFSYKRGVPRGLDMIFDCRFLSNPHWQPDLRGKDGRDILVQNYVKLDPRYDEFFQKVEDLLLFLLPAHVSEGKAYLTIGFGCTGGQHRSVALTEMIALALTQKGWSVSKRHRELERKGSAQSAVTPAEVSKA